MAWYLIRALVSIHVAGKLVDYEEDFRLMSTDDPSRVMREARRLASLENDSYKNIYGQTVRWKLDQVSDVTPLAVPEPVDATWLYSRAYPGVSHIDARDPDRVEVFPSSARSPRGEAEWYGAMLLLRLRQPRPHEEEHLLLFRAATFGQAHRRALALGMRRAAELGGELLGFFDVVDLFDKEIESGTEVYWRFYRPGLIKDKNSPPRQLRWITVPDRV
jgi:hypothetical protein